MAASRPEYPHLRNIRVFEPGGRVETHGFQYADRAIAAGRRMIVFSGHIANWEIAMLAGDQYGISVASSNFRGSASVLNYASLSELR